MIIRGDARALPIVDGVVDCCVTSPPYFGLRDYGNPQQIGLEPTPDAFVAALVAVFREVRRVLKDNGTLWLNLGDSYAGRGVTGGMNSITTQASAVGARGWVPPAKGFKDKDLYGIPWRVALALQADGWYLRSDIIWSKPNPMPESVTDRPTKAHEYLFLLAKSERYHYDADAIAEPVSAAMLDQMEHGYSGLGLKDYEAAGVQNPSTVKARIIAKARDRFDRKRKEVARRCQQHRENMAPTEAFMTRNRRTVWTIRTQPYKGSHYATMPEALVMPCIMAGCPAGGLVLDPFLGSGTVGAVAERLGRRWVGTDLSYQPQSGERTAQRGLMFAEVPA